MTNRPFPTSKLPRIWLAILLVFSMTVYVGSAMAVDSRMDQRAAEMPMPDPYLDPTWPEEEPTEGLGDRYDEGDSDSVEEIPLDEEEALDAEQRALQAWTEPVPASAFAEPGAAPMVPPAAPTNGSAPVAPAAPTPVPDPENEILPGDDHRDPVEW